MDVDLRALALVEHVAVLVAVRPDVADAALDFVHQLATAVLKHLLQLFVPARLG
jgi:hypothetical protein